MSGTTEVSKTPFIWTDPTSVVLGDDHLGNFIGANTMAQMSVGSEGQITYRVFDSKIQNWTEGHQAAIGEDWSDLGYGGIQVRLTKIPGIIQCRRRVYPV